MEIKLNSTRKKGLEKGKLVLATVSESYYNLLNVYTAQRNKLTKVQKKRMKVQNWTENLPIDLYLDEDEEDLPPMPPLKDDEEV